MDCMVLLLWFHVIREAEINILRTEFKRVLCFFSEKKKQKHWSQSGWFFVKLQSNPSNPVLATRIEPQLSSSVTALTEMAGFYFTLTLYVMSGIKKPIIIPCPTYQVRQYYITWFETRRLLHSSLHIRAYMLIGELFTVFFIIILNFWLTKLSEIY